MEQDWKTDDRETDNPAAAERRIAALEAMVSELRESAEAWRAAALRYHRILDHVNDGILELDREGRFTFVNEVIARRAGIPQEVFTMLHFTDIIIDEDHPCSDEAFERILAGAAVPPFEIRCRGREGAVVPVELNATPIYSAGRITGVRGVTRNLTERKRMEAEILELNQDLERRVVERTAQLASEIEERRKMEKALAESEERFRNFMENSPIGLCVTDLAGRVQFINKRIEQASGLKLKDIVGCDALSMGFFNEETKQKLLDRLAARLEGDEARVTEIPVTMPDGSVFWIDLKTEILKKDGVPFALQLAFINITERKRAEQALRESETRYRELVDFLPLALFEIDADGTIRSGNAAIFETFGYAPEDLARGLNAFEMIVPEDRERMTEAMQRIFAGELTGGTEYTARRKGGERFPIAIFAGSIVRNDQAVGLRGAIIDLTRLKKAEDELQQAHELLMQAEKLASIGRLSAGVAHEILNPINIISMGLQILADMKNLPDTVTEELRVCRDQIRRIVAIAENLRQFSRIAAKKLSMNSISDAVDRVLSLYGPQFSLEEVKMDVRHQPDMPIFLFDREKIEQVILNLVVNAVQALANVGEKMLRIETSWDGTDDGGTVARVMIADNGPGIPEEDMPKLFEPFFTTKDYGEGTGLGLSISYGIVQDHGGEIWAENNEWGGASFLFELPVNRAGEG